ncbi:MAG TPA: hypothetical protein VNF50_06740 [Acidimicrobiales bacterium]|nr:hypothetical protein [Acidimicrobiales bacterium]
MVVATGPDARPIVKSSGVRDPLWRRAAQDSAGEIADMLGPIDVARTLRSSLRLRVSM